MLTKLNIKVKLEARARARVKEVRCCISHKDNKEMRKYNENKISQPENHSKSQLKHADLCLSKQKIYSYIMRNKNRAIQKGKKCTKK